MENTEKTGQKERDIRSFKPDDQKDIQAVNEVLSGNKEAYSRILVRYRPHLLQKFYKSLNDRDAAEDMTSDVLVKAYQMLGKYKMTHTFNAWLTKVATNHLIDCSRRGTCKLEASTTSYDNMMGGDEGISFAESVVDREASADSLVMNKERSRIIAEAMSNLDETGRMLIGMFYGKEMSYEEITAETGMVMNTMKPRLMQAKRELAEYISKKYPEMVKRPLEKADVCNAKVEVEIVDGIEVESYYL